MKGGIYPNKGRGAPWSVRFKSVHKRFNNYRDAERFLTGLRFKEDEGTFDPRDYQKDNPLGLETLSRAWLTIRSKDMKSLTASSGHIKYAIAYFGNKNIKEIGYGELEDFFHGENLAHLSDKSRHNIRTTLHSFWKWVIRRNQNITMPEFPEIKFNLKFRKTVSLELQDKILYEIERTEDRREWVCCLILSTYPKIRPGELLKVKEKDLDLDYGIIRIRHPKAGGWKEVKLLSIHTELIKTLPKGFPEQYFCRHDDGKYKGQRYGVNYLNREVWKPACQRLGIEGVSLYPGMKHSTIRALRKQLRPDEIQKGAGIKSNSAFTRYFSTEYEDELKLYEARQSLRECGKDVVKISDHEK